MSHPQEPSIEGRVYFYPPEYYVFDNFSSFQVTINGKEYPTSEHAYQSLKFAIHEPELAEKIKNARSAHDAFTLARMYDELKDPEWDEKKHAVMKEILHAKVRQHPYVMQKLRQSGDREIVEDSWRDNHWGWGPDRDGENMLGKIWMEVREEILGRG